MKNERADKADTRADKSDIRMDHLEQKTAADQHVSEQVAGELAVHVEELIGGVKDLAGGVKGLEHAEHRRNKLLIIASVLVFAFGVVFLLSFARSFDNQQELANQGLAIQAQAAQTKSLLRVVLAVTGCTEQHTPEQCRETVQQAGQGEGNRRIEIVDCVVRSIHEGDTETTTRQRCLDAGAPK